MTTTAVLTDAQREAVYVLADTLIPEHSNAPSADQAGVAAEFIDEVLGLRDDLVPGFLAILDRASLTEPREFCEALRVDEPDAFSLLTFVIAGAYLLSPKARDWLRYKGQIGEPQDGSPQQEYAPGGLLDVVRSRGPIYRPTPAGGDAARA